jgi:hypothetical protein
LRLREESMNIQAKVALDKEKRPEDFCKVRRCLWRTRRCDPMTREMVPSPNCENGYCPRHKYLAKGVSHVQENQDSVA